MDKTTVEFGRWRVVRTDPMNWQLFERREIQSGKREGDVDWVGMANYFGRLIDAVRFARDREVAACGYDGSLDGAIKKLRQIDKKFLADLKEALEGGRR